jgi:hypothetical protein
MTFRDTKSIKIEVEVFGKAITKTHRLIVGVFLLHSIGALHKERIGARQQEALLPS